MRILLTKVGKEELEPEKNLHRSVDNLVPRNIKNQQRIDNENKTKNYRRLLLNLYPKSINNYNQQVTNTESNKITPLKNKNNYNVLSMAGYESINNNPNIKYNKYNNINNVRSNNNLPPYKIIDIQSKNSASIKKFYGDEKENDENEKNNNDNDNNNPLIVKSNTDTSLPSIQYGLPLKNLLANKNKEKINGDLLEKEISGNSLIDYLKSDKTIYPSFIEKINKANDQQLFKLDKVCYKYFNDEIKNNSIKNHIQNTIKNEYFKDAVYFKDRLRNMSNDLKGIENSYNNLRLHKKNYDHKRTSILRHKNYGIKKEDNKISNNY